MKQKQHSNWHWSGLLALVLFSAIGLLLRELVAIPSPSPSLRPSPTASSTSSPPSPNLTFHVSRVIDGDTIELSNGQIVRYIGIDAPELRDRNAQVTCFSTEAFARNKELVENKDVRLEKDVSETDRYGRLLRYVYLDQTSIGEILISEGFARAKNYPPDNKFKNLFAQEELRAKTTKIGLWEKCA